MNEELENLINYKLNSVAEKNSMVNHNFIMNFKILENINTVEETYIDYQIKQYKKTEDYSKKTINKLIKYLNESIELVEIRYEDLFYSPLDNNMPCKMHHFSSWFYKNDGEIIINSISPIRDEIIYLIRKYIIKKESRYLIIKDEPPELINGNFFSEGYHLFICIEKEILMFEFTMFD